MGSKKKLWGNIKLDKLKEVIEISNSDVVHTFEGDKEVTVQATQWEDGNISVDVFYDGKYHSVLRLMESKKNSKEDTSWL